jgi:cytochrome c553
VTTLPLAVWRKIVQSITQQGQTVRNDTSRRRGAAFRSPLAAGVAAFVLALACAGAAQAQGAAATSKADTSKADSETVQRAVHVCDACHGENARTAAVVVPRLAGQMALYTIAQLRDFRNQTRAETDTQAYMWGVSALLDDATIEGLAEYYAQQPPASGKPARAADKALVEAGRRIFVDGNTARGVRACASCHGDKAEGAAGFPRLAGQRASYVQRQLQVFGTRLRPHGIIMKGEAAGMSAREMKAVAAYVQTL